MNQVMKRLVVFLIALSSSAVPFAAEFCVDTTDCNPGQECIGGGCVDPILSVPAEVAAMISRWTSVVRLTQIPAVFDPDEVCCFDLDGDGSIDDANGSLLAALAPLLGNPDFNGTLLQNVSDGQEIGFIDWRELDPGLAAGDVQFSWYPFDWVGEPDYATVVAGDGHLLVHDTAIGSHGSAEQFNDGGVVSAGEIDVKGNRITLPSITASGLSGPGVSELVTLYKPRLAAELAYDGNASAVCEGLCSVDEDRGGLHDPPLVGGARLGGLLSAVEQWQTLDRVLRACDCAGVDPTQPVVTWAPSGGRLSATCTANTGGDPVGCDETPWCEQISTICLSLTVQSSTLDQDLDDDGILDSWSAGFRLGFSGVTVDGSTAMVFSDGFESGDTSIWSVAQP